MSFSSGISKVAFVGLLSSSVLLSGCIIHVGGGEGVEFSTYGDNNSRDFTKTNKSVTVPSGLNVDEVSSVNGSVTIKDNVTAKEVSNVNGRISIGDGVSVDSVDMVNGQITINKNFNSKGDVETVNGNIYIKQNSRIGGQVETVNGNIDLKGVQIDNNIVTVNGSIYISEGSVIKGDIVFDGKPNKYNNRNRPPVLKIDSSSTIDGQIIVYKEVEFDFDDSSLLEKIVRR